MAKEKNLAHPKWPLGKSSLIIFDKFCQLKYRYDNQRSWSERRILRQFRSVQRRGQVGAFGVFSSGVG